MMETRIQREFIETGLGFPVRLINVPMIYVRGVWTPKIDYRVLDMAVLQALARRASPLTGDEVRFVRLYFDMTLQEFGERFGVSHAGVIKWENAKLKPTNMTWTTEKDLRLFILSKLKAAPREFVNLYAELKTRPNDRPSLISLDLLKLAA